MYEMVKTKQIEQIGMNEICQIFGITRQAHYQKLGREQARQVEEKVILEMVRQVRRRHPRMGTSKVLHKIKPMLAAEGLSMGRDRLFDLLREENMLVKRKKAYRKTTLAGLWRARNLLPGLTVSQINQVWVCDITYLEVEIGRFVYLFLLMDLYSRCILGWEVSASLAAEGAVTCLEMAFDKQQTSFHPGLIHHSDHGIQYTSHIYIQTLVDHKAQLSMGAVGNCYDNIFAERLNGILKDEYLLGDRFVDIAQVFLAVQQAVFLYNTDRPHLALNMATPAEVYSGNHSQKIPSLIFPESTEHATNY